MAYRRILVAIDFSENSQPAINKAQELARVSGAELVLVHFVEIPVFPVLEDVAVLGLPGLWGDDDAQKLIQASSYKLSKLASQFDLSHFEVLAGIASRDIVSYANEKECDLIVMGSHGISGIKRLIGSTTNAVMNHASCDVLMVRI